MDDASGAPEAARGLADAPGVDRSQALQAERAGSWLARFRRRGSKHIPRTLSPLRFHVGVKPQVAEPA